MNDTIDGQIQYGIEKLVYLLHDKGVVDSFLGHELIMIPKLHHCSITEANNHVCCADGGQVVGNYNGSATSSCLARQNVQMNLYNMEQCMVDHILNTYSASYGILYCRPTNNDYAMGLD